VGEPDDIQQSNIAFAALDAADVVAVEAGQLGQALLREAALDPSNFWATSLRYQVYYRHLHTRTDGSTS
jgi:hypothetical protein